jgi:hypothetical protein
MTDTKKLIIKIKCTINDTQQIPDMEEFLGFVSDEIKTLLEDEDISITDFDLIENT